MGDITLEKYDVQGVFINVVAYYWQRKCNVTLGWLNQRLSGAEAMLKHLIQQGLIKHNSDTDCISINFQVEQYKDLIDLHEILSESGRKGAQARLKGGLKVAKARLKHKDKDKDKDIITSFEQFWNLYEKRVGRTKALKEWEKLSESERSDALNYIPLYKSTKEKQFRKDPERFLKHKCWNDEIITANGKSENGQTKHTGYVVDPNKFYNR